MRNTVMRGLISLVLFGLMLGSVGIAHAQTSAVTKVYWTDRDGATLYVTDLGSGVTQPLAQGVYRLQDVDLETNTGTLYFAEWGPPVTGPGSIKQVNKDGTGLATVFTATEAAVHQLALDQINQIIYFTRAVSTGGHEISSVDYSGGNYTVLFSGGFSGPGWFPSGLALDSANNFLYWGDIGVLNLPPNGSVNRMTTTGAAPTQLTPHVNGRGRGFAFEPASQTIFLTAHNPLSPGSGGGLFSYDIPTDVETQLISDPFTGYWDIEIDPIGQRIWWTDYGRGQIRSAKFDGSDVQIELSGLTRPYGLALELVAEADLEKLEMQISGPSEIPVSEQVFYGVDEVLRNNGPHPQVDVRDIKKLDCPHPGDPPEFGSEAAYPTQCSWVFDRLVEEVEVMWGVQYYLKRDTDSDGKCDPPKRRWFVGAQDHQQIPRSQLPPPPPDDPDQGPVRDGDCIVADSTPGVFKEIGVKKQVVLRRGQPVQIHEEFDVHCTGPSFHTFTLQDRIEAKDPAIRDPNPDNNALQRKLRVACIAQADLAITAWEVPSRLRAKVSERLFFETRKTLHNFGPFGPVDAEVWKTMVIPPGAEGSVHVTPDEAPATIVIERPDGTTEVRENQPASTTVFVEGPARLSIHFKVRGLEVSVDRVVREDFDVHCLRADRFLFTLSNEVMPQDPHVRDPNEANNRVTRTLVLECPVEEGRMTGGGSVLDPSVGRVTHGFELHCDETVPPNNLQVNWSGNRFHLETLTSAFCSDDPTIDPSPPAAPFDTYEGTGTGRCNGQPASITWKFTDAGEPGVNDTAEISISGACTLTVSGKLDRGDHQAHPAEAGKPRRRARDGGPFALQACHHDHPGRGASEALVIHNPPRRGDSALGL